MVMRKTKIIYTLGPATNNEEKIRQLMLNGMDVARMNFSHGDHASHLATLNIIKKVREELNLPVAALLDTKGPEIRVCKFKNDRIELHTGDTFTLTTKDIEGTQDIVSITYKNLINDVQVGGRILIDDGLIELSVIKKTDTDIICRALNNGAVSAIISFLRTLVFQLICVFLLPVIFDIDGIWLAIAFAEVCAFIISLLFLISKRKQYHYI